MLKVLRIANRTFFIDICIPYLFQIIRMELFIIIIIIYYDLIPN